jgi:hypothetical protein
MGGTRSGHGSKVEKEHSFFLYTHLHSTKRMKDLEGVGLDGALKSIGVSLILRS